MFKPILAATAVLAIAGSSLAYAQQRSDGPGDGGPQLEHRHRPSAEDIKAFTDARIAALKAGLELTPDQEKNWPAFEQAVRDMAAARAQRMQARRARMAAGDQPQHSANPFDRLQHRADAMTQRGAVLKRVADAGAPLYMSLSDAQQHRFKKLARMLRRHHHRMHAGNNEGGRGGQDYGRRGDNGGGWREGSGYGRDNGWGGYQGDQSGRGFDENGPAPGGRFHDRTGSGQHDEQL